jgi:hypothetical protein
MTSASEKVPGATNTLLVHTDPGDVTMPAAKQMVRYVIEVQAVQPGDARFHAELTSSTLK